MSRCYVLEVRNVGATEWRAVKAYLSEHQAEKARLRAAWEDHVEARVAIYAELPEGTEYRKVNEP